MLIKWMTWCEFRTMSAAMLKLEEKDWNVTWNRRSCGEMLGNVGKSRRVGKCETMKQNATCGILRLERAKMSIIPKGPSCLQTVYRSLPGVSLHLLQLPSRWTW
jgi:hypothetical protein